MKEFKNLMPYRDALEVLLSKSVEMEVEEIDLEGALGRVLSDDVQSPIDSPPFDRSAMDGYALLAEDTFSVSESSWANLEVIDDITAGEVTDKQVSSGKAVGIMTGAKMPLGADAVVMQEFTRRDGNRLQVGKRIPPRKNVSLKGEDVRLDEKVLSAGTRLSAEQIATLRSLGIMNVSVRRKPVASVIVTGDEFTESPGAEGKIFESNSIMLSKLLEAVGCEVGHVGVVNDDEHAILEAIDLARGSDLVMITGGSSFGKKDMSSVVFEDFLFHGVTIKPGRPFGFAMKEGLPIFVMSGYPVAAIVQFYLFAVPFFEKCMNTSMLKKIKLPMSAEHPSQLGRMEFVRCSIEDGKVVPIRKSGSSMLASLARADGFILIDEVTEGLNRGEMVDFRFFL